MTANMYRVGDYVYFESSSTSPYQIRRIEELNKTPNGNVEAKVMCFYRRRDLPNTLIMLADKHQMASADESPVSAKLKKLWLKAPSADEAEAVQPLESPPDDDDESTKGSTNSGDKGGDALSTKQRHQMKHRELFLSRQVETLPATHIRGKCSVTLLNETESLLSYLNKDDTFFYCLVFDPAQKTLLADKGEIRVGSRYQADNMPLLKEGDADDRNSEDLETLVWTPSHHLTDRQIDQFLVISRSVGTFARALDCSSSIKQPSLHMSAAAASRDITLFHAMDTLHKHKYNTADAISSLVPSTGPVLCRDEMEEWSASEANLFEEALEKYGKDFNDIRQDFLPWKTLKNIIEYYYMWKTTDRYVQQKRVKAVEAESKLKQVYIPNYNKPNPAVINNSKGGIVNGNGNGAEISSGGKACESCSSSSSSQWYAWGPSQMHCKLCSNCWNYWKKYGGLKSPSRIEENDIDLKKKSSGSLSDEERGSSMNGHRHRCSIVNCGKEFKLKAHLARHYATAHGLAIRSGSPRPIMKTRTAFYLFSTPLTRVSRRLCRNLLMVRHAARAPFWPINIAAVKQDCQMQIVGKGYEELKELTKYKKKDRGSVTNIATSLAKGELIVPPWLAPTDKALIPKSEQISFPRPPKGPDGSIIYERIPNKPEAEKVIQNSQIGINNMSSSSSLKRRAYEEMNGMDPDMLEWGEETNTPPRPRWPHSELNTLARDLTSIAGPPPSKRPHKDSAPVATSYMPRHMGQTPGKAITRLNGKTQIATLTQMKNGQKRISWSDAPDDMYFHVTDNTKTHFRKLRKQLTNSELRRAARKPWRRLRCNEADLLAAAVAAAAASSRPISMVE
ncbi:metastasis-associated protein MTA3 [Neocloeon triangulifer]|uniref:metastasis-associated protein MTA3 n=1 Tax=Neocloeon triangulifer TaxID=2078957 RepID=UPI00286F75F8|nr:metastasis-associated protein MTA3 [Neocloeon triangulifer]